MINQTLRTDREGLVQLVERLPDRYILQVTGYIERIREEESSREAEEERRYRSMTPDEVGAEIEALEAVYGTTPNAETIAAMKEAESGLCEKTTVEELIAELNALA